MASCPNEFGGRCLGELAAGTYTTRVFETPLTYTVPDGWANYEDLPGNVLLVPPTASLEGVDAGTADYVSVLDGIAVANAECIGRSEPAAGRDPGAMAAYFAAHEGLATSEPVAVTVGGLNGVVIDIALAEGYTDGCPFSGWEGIPMVPMLIGVAPADLHHVVLGDSVTRLYLLEGQNRRVLAIEVSDVAGGTDLAELDAIVDEFVFSTEG